MSMLMTTVYLGRDKADFPRSQDIKEIKAKAVEVHSLLTGTDHDQRNYK